jgi:polysaccharide export outer membrane protein
MILFLKSKSTPWRSHARWSVAALALAWLGGCAFAPGLSIGKGVQQSSQPATPADTRPQNSQSPPPGALLNISPELIDQQRAMRKNELGNDVKSLFGEAKPYGIGPGDVLNIVVWNHPEMVLASGYNVSTEGLIQFPLLGTFKIAGMTEIRAREELTRRLAKFLQDPQITLRIQNYRTGRVYVDGEVRTPGQQAINDIPMTLPEVISRAGGFTPTADRATIAVTRKGATTVVNMQQLVDLGINPSRILLASGDLVRVGNSDDTKVYVLGEVTRPVALPLRNGRLTLNQALGESLGINPVSGDPRQIYIVRSRNGDSGVTARSDSASTVSPTTPEIYHLDANSPTAYALAEGFELKPRDVVFVDPVPLVLWNRVISLILPSAAGITATRAVTN